MVPSSYGRYPLHRASPPPLHPSFWSTWPLWAPRTRLPRACTPMLPTPQTESAAFGPAGMTGASACGRGRAPPAPSRPPALRRTEERSPPSVPRPPFRQVTPAAATGGLPVRRRKRSLGSASSCQSRCGAMFAYRVQMSLLWNEEAPECQGSAQRGGRRLQQGRDRRRGR